MSEASDAMYSTPVYAEGLPNAPVTRRFLVCQVPQQLTDLRQQLPADDLPSESLSAAEAGDAFEARLTALLQEATIGTHLYVRGDESFLWHVRAAAYQQGLMDDEISLFRTGDRRNVYCVHCSHMQDVGPGDETTCGGCGVVLTIRTHFSKRLGAYQGVCLDPDDPYGEAR
ncbi:MAG: dimethylamine monooxygenase subunit DmmA family protein [Halofilum sp. (in: g-proteobacteria)]